MKISIFFLFILFLFVGSLNAKELSVLPHVESGLMRPPGNKRVLLPKVGTGVRFKKGRHGGDISINAGSLVFTNYINPKAVYLFYPEPRRNCQFYFGTGLGLGYNTLDVPNRDKRFGVTSKKQSWITSEFVLGCEFNTHKRVKPFIQIDLSQNLFSLKGPHAHRGGIGIGASCGIRF